MLKIGAWNLSLLTNERSKMIAEATAMIGELETSLGIPTFAFFANWTGEYAVDANEEAGHLLSSMIMERTRRTGAEQVALILGARGGYPAFADIVLRTVRQMGIEVQAVLTCRVDGAVGILAAGCDSLTLHPQAGIGALDAGLCVVPRREIDSALLEHWPGDTANLLLGDEGREGIFSRIANDRLIRNEQYHLACRVLPQPQRDEDEELDTEVTTDDPLRWILEAELGRGTTVGTSTLRGQGLQARVAPDPLSEQLEDLLDWASSTLHLFSAPQDRFQVSEWADEVEFDLATTVKAAAIVGIDAVWIHELDTGSPDPDAPRLTGRWRGWDPEAASEQEDDS